MADAPGLEPVEKVPEESHAKAQRFLRESLLLCDFAQTPAVDALAARILEQGIIPPTAAPDAEHTDLAAVHAMNLLLTWNCKHIANAFHRRRVEAVCADAGTAAAGLGKD